MGRESIKGKVLLAEDTHEIQSLITALLRKIGVEIDIANDGEVAVSLANSNEYSLILMDMQMPVMDGYTAVKTLRASGYNKPIIALTANAEREDKESCLALGCNDFLAKPLQRELLYEVINRYLDDPADDAQTELVSSLFETDPEMMNMVKTFLETLPDYINQGMEAMQRENWEALASVLHVLKGVGGSYGYQIISETAAAAEKLLKENDYQAVRPLVEKLQQLNVAAQHSFQQQTG